MAEACELGQSSNFDPVPAEPVLAKIAQIIFFPRDHCAVHSLSWNGMIATQVLDCCASVQKLAALDFGLAVAHPPCDKSGHRWGN